MAKLTLDVIPSGYASVDKFNENFDRIEAAMENTLSRDGTTPNSMGSSLDMNSQRIINLPEPLSDNEAARLQDVQNAIAGGAANLIEFTPYSTITSTNLQAALQEVVDDLSSSSGSSLVGHTEGTVANALNSRLPSIDNYTALRAYTGTTTSFYVKGHTAALDGGAGVFAVDSGDITSADNGGTILVDVSGRRWKREFVGSVRPVWWGADPSGVIHATSATQAAINYASAAGVGVHWDAGQYRYAAASPALDPGTADLVMSGDGMHATVLIFEEGSSTGAAAARKHLFRNDTSTPKGALEFYGIQIRGTWTSGGFVERGGAPFFLNFYSEINIHDCKLFDLSSFGTWCEAIGHVKFQNNHCEQIVRDMCRFRSSFNVVVTGNHFLHGDDDAVALHQQDVLTGTQIREGIVVADNVFEDVLGIKVLGGRMVSVQNNVMRRPKVLGVHVIADLAEGDCPQFGISIKDNAIYDLIERAPFSTSATSAIAVYSLGRKAAADTGGIVPGENNTGTGAFVLPFAYRNNAFSAAGQSTPPQFFVQITGNIISRTLPDVAEYDDWGYGQAMSATGFSNALVAASVLRPQNGIFIEGDTRKALVSGNIVSHTDNAVLLAAPLSSFAGDNFSIRANIFHDFTTAAVNVATPGATQSMNLAVTDNEIDGDPYHTASNRGAGGTWATNGLPNAYRCESIKGTRFSRNHIKNICRPVFTSFEFNQVMEHNILRCDPASTGFSTSNRGIGDIPVAGERYRHEVFDSNPTSATYSQQINACPQEAVAQPSSGKWVAGTFVKNVNYGAAIHGWIRTTTGTAHVAGTDWRQINMV